MVAISIDVPDQALDWLKIMAKECDMGLEDFLLQNLGEIIGSDIDSRVLNGKSALEVVTWAEEQVPGIREVIERMTNERAPGIWQMAALEVLQTRKRHLFRNPESLK